jgi:hypothetical protein
MIGEHTEVSSHQWIRISKYNFFLNLLSAVVDANCSLIYFYIVSPRFRTDVGNFRMWTLHYSAESNTDYSTMKIGSQNAGKCTVHVLGDEGSPLLPCLTRPSPQRTFNNRAIKGTKKCGVCFLNNEYQVENFDESY